jgi:hypothetical protein
MTLASDWLSAPATACSEEAYSLDPGPKVGHWSVPMLVTAEECVVMMKTRLIRDAPPLQGEGDINRASHDDTLHPHAPVSLPTTSA